MRVFGDRADRGAHLVGSVPAATSHEAMSTVAGALGDRLERLPDGETGQRADWIAWQYPILAATPGLVPSDAGAPSYHGRAPLALAAAAPPVSLRGSLGYAAAAIASYEVFVALRAEGIVPSWCRFQVSLPTPLSPVAAFVAEGSQARVEPVYEAAMLAEVGTILGAIPHADLAIQWDANFEFAMLDGSLPAWFDDIAGGVAAGVNDRLVRLGELIPVDVQLGYHFCQDHRRLQHERPYDAAGMVDTAVAVVRTMRRRIDWLHLPVPEARLDVTFFEKLAPLSARPDIDLYLGVIHPHEGDAGAEARITAAHRYLKHFGIASTCGLGRHPSSGRGEVLRLHRAASSPVAAAPPPAPRPTMAS